MKYGKYEEILTRNSVGHEEKIEHRNLDLHLINLPQKLWHVQRLTMPANNLADIVAEAFKILFDPDRAEKFYSELYYFIINQEPDTKSTLKAIEHWPEGKVLDSLIQIDWLMKAVLDFSIQWMHRNYPDVDKGYEQPFVTAIGRTHSVYVIIGQNEEAAEEGRKLRWHFSQGGNLLPEMV